mmetsp:Transcript_13642/g.20769  ORF Transcript_13642/g.20769 Transcript_13642/m.20769 type:complete len:334 (+) Transcript_13642:135-1136(+)
MSDFASLLNDFQKSAAEREDPRQTKQSRPFKRQRIFNQSESSPNDVHLLSVKIDFLCIGAQKAGTTWLHEMLRKIPELGLPENTKEVHFWDWHRRKGLGWYSKQFPQSHKNLLLGEITPCYMALKEHDVKEIHKLFPDARIIFIARDLVERAWSALTMELRNEARGLKAGEFDIAYEEMNAATRNKLQHDSDPKNYTDDFFMERLQNWTHTARSDYASGLKLWLKYFSCDQILILNYNDISEKPKEFLTLVLKHIRLKDIEDVLETHLTTKELAQRFNATISPSCSIRPSLRTKMELHLREYAIDFNTLLDQNWPNSNLKLDEYPQGLLKFPK